MRINEFEKMQQSLNQMKNNLNDIRQMEKTEHINQKERRAVQKEINRIKHPKITKIAKEEQIIVLFTIAIVAVTFIFSTTIFAKSIAENSENAQEIVEEKSNDENIANEENIVEQPLDESGNLILESNENAIELENILLENVSVLKSKEYAEEIRNIEFETKYQENNSLPEGEEIVVQEGKNGSEQVTVIKSYENNVFISENVLAKTLLQEYIPQIIDKGTSKFLADNKVHLGDKMYVTEEVSLMQNAEKNSDEICTIFKSLDVIIEEIVNEDWCKIEYDGLEGFVKTKYLTSSKVTPGIVEANRIQKIKMTLNEDMALNQSTKLTLEDYKKILSKNSSDKNKVIEDNAEVFYNMDKVYNMNGVFLASMAIHESAWGTSTIANDKKNLFGYGAYDSSPYSSSFSFDTYAEGIELLAKVLVKYYLNEAGTAIYGGEIATGAYYNDPTVAGVNIRYASDENWHNKVYKYMEELYNRL